jgi:Fanconi anemia group M protein
MTMLKELTPRLYQEAILATAAERNTLVVLPTGMGKTAVALLLAAQRLKDHPGSKALVLAPTKPLAEQHLETFRKHLDIPGGELALMTGEVAPEKRASLWTGSRIICATPQGVENDLITGKIAFDDVRLLVIDEAHRAVGNYSYVFLAKQYLAKARNPRILALTASPGHEAATIEEVCGNLGIEAVEVRTEEDADVKPYLHEIDMSWRRVDLPEEFRKAQAALQRCIQGKLRTLRSLGLTSQLTTKREVLAAQAELQRRLAAGERDPGIWQALSLLAEVTKAQHALELLECQGLSPLLKYLDRFFTDAMTSRVKAVRSLAADSDFKQAAHTVRELASRGLEHPKVAVLRDIVSQELAAQPLTKLIVFTQFRDTAVRIKEELAAVKHCVPAVFVGQAKKGETGMSQKEQSEMLQQFRDGLYNVLIATSVAEEGLDIPQVDTVIFYEPLPSAIRTIQRRGRTGRHEKGRVVVLVTRNTRDEAYSWSARNREAGMNRFLTGLRTRLGPKLIMAQQAMPAPPVLADDKPVTVYADYREKGSGVVRALVEHGVRVQLAMLPSADYLPGSRVGVELKTVEDFVSSLVDGRLLSQLRELRQGFERPLILLLGEQDLYGVRAVHPNAIRGMLATIAVSYAIPVLQAKTPDEAAQLLIAIAKREQGQEARRPFAPHASRKPVSLGEQQEYLVSALPNVGPQLARSLLRRFRTVRKVFTATEDELRQVEGVGEKTATAIREALDKEYEER